MTDRQPSTSRVIRWLLPFVVAILVLVGTIALAVRQRASLPQHRLQAPDLTLVAGVAVAVCCVIGLLIFLLSAPSAMVSGGPRKRTTPASWVARIALLVLVYVIARYRGGGAGGGFLNGLMPAQEPARSNAPPAPLSEGSSTTMVVLLAVLGLTVVAAVVTGLILARDAARHNVGEIVDEPELDTTLAAAVGAARRATFAADDDPREVVIGCYEVFEIVIARRGVARRVAQTASAALEGAVVRGILSGAAAEAARELVEVFERARFSPHPMSVADVALARRCLVTIDDHLAAPLLVDRGVERDNDNGTDAGARTGGAPGGGGAPGSAG